MKILILGGHGFVGRNVAQELKGTDNQVHQLSRRDGLDLRDYNKTKKYLKKIMPDIIINVAAHGGSLHYVTDYAADVIYDNIQMTLNIYKAIREICPDARIINPLSNCSYPANSKIQKEENWLKGEVHLSVFSYGNYKRFLYVISKCYNMQYNIDSINLLVPNTYGPGDSIDPNKTHALNGMIIRMLKAKNNMEKKFEIWGTGKPVREWAYITDVSKVLAMSMNIEKPIIYPINLAQNKGYSIKESAELIAKALNYKGELFFNTNYQDGAPIKILNDEKFRKTFPNFEFFEHYEGIKETVKYYKKNMNIKRS